MIVDVTEQPPEESALKAEMLIKRFNNANQRRQNWTSIWEDCYDFTLPQRSGFQSTLTPGRPRTNQIFDATAMDAAEQLAASLLGQLTPSWSQWFGLKPGPDLSPAEADALAPVLEQAAKTIQAHFDRSNFAVEIHQCYLDLVVGGTASLSFEETDPGGFSAFRFQAIPLTQIVLEEGTSGYLDGAYHLSEMTLDEIASRYPFAEIPSQVLQKASQDPQTTFEVLETVLPEEMGYDYNALLVEQKNNPILLKSGRFNSSPIISFRWLKSPGEIYGRSPVMKALPDIKTANKVVELVLKNASISVTGIWQADDDGILNPANIDLTPGSIIPKAVGSRGLQPLTMPGSFDVSQLMLDKLQARIRHALLADRLLPATGPARTATEILERSAQISMLLGATYGRLQTELLTPLIQRAFAILRRRGEVPDVALDGRLVSVDYRSPLAQAQGQRNVQNVLNWVSSVSAMGPEAALTVNFPATARYIGESLGVPSDLIRNENPLDLIGDVIAEVDETLQNGAQNQSESGTDQQDEMPEIMAEPQAENESET